MSAVREGAGSQSLNESGEWITTGDLDARRAPVEVNKQVADQEQREDAAAKVNVRNHPFDWWDLVLFAIPVASTVVAMFCEAE